MATPKEQNAMDYTNARPMCKNPRWAPNLDELNKHLCELSDAI